MAPNRKTVPKRPGKLDMTSAYSSKLQDNKGLTGCHCPPLCDLEKLYTVSKSILSKEAGSRTEADESWIVHFL